MEEVDELGGGSREMYRRTGSGTSIGGPDAGSLTASGLWHQDEEPTDSFYEKHDRLFTPLDNTLGILVPREVLLLEGDEPGRDHLYAYTDAGFPLTRDFNPDLATMKAGPLYLDLISITGTLLYSDYKGEGKAGDTDGWLSSVSLAFRGIAQFSEHLYLTVSGEVYYLPGDNELGFYFGNGNRSFARIAYEAYIGTSEWEYVLFDEIGAYHHLSEIFDEVEHDEIEQAGRYRFGRSDNDRDTDYFDTDSLFFLNRAGASISGPLSDLARASASYEHFDYWKTLEFEHVRAWDRLSARLDYGGEDWRFAPYLEYTLAALDDWDILNHTAWLGVRGRISENLRAQARVGYYKSTGTNRDLERPVYEVGLIHELGPNTTHSLFAGASEQIWDDAENRLATYTRYTMKHRFGSRLQGNGYVQYSELDVLDSGLADRNGWSGGASLTAHISDYTKLRAGAYFREWDFSDSTPGTARWIYRASLSQRVLPYVYARLLYQYEDFDVAGRVGYEEHLYMLSLTHLF